jgi:hypothetical protein
MLFNAYELEEHTRQRQAALRRRAERQILARQDWVETGEATPVEARRMTPGWFRRKLAIR